MDCKYSVLDTQNSIPTYCFKEARKYRLKIGLLANEVKKNEQVFRKFKQNELL